MRAGLVAAFSVSLLALLSPGTAAAAPGSAASAKARPARGAPGSRPGLEAAPASPQTHVEADSIEYLYKERRTVMTGKPLVKLTREDATLLCRKLTADHDEGGDIRHAVCDGDVRITRGDRIVTCRHAIYDAPTGKIVCQGDPVLRDGLSVMSCEEVVYDLAADKIFLKQGKGTLVQRPGQNVVRRRTKEP